MKKNTLVKAAMLLFMLTATQSLWAQDEQLYCLAVEYASGEVDYFAFESKPVATFSETALSITQDGEDTYYIEDIVYEDIKKWSFTDAIPSTPETGGIGGVAMDGSSMTFSAGKALMTGLGAGSQVHVYTVDGQTVLSVTANQDGSAMVDLGGLKGGQVYIVRTPSASYKIVK